MIFEIEYNITFRVFAIFIISMISMLIAQCTKVVVNSIKNDTFAWHYFFTTGGMPSSHSSTMFAMLTTLGILQWHYESGLGYEFAIALSFTAVVVYDAMGVRYQAGRHAQILNELLKEEPKQIQEKIGYDGKESLKVLLGHKPREVFFGAILGILVGIIGSLIYIAKINL